MSWCFAMLGTDKVIKDLVFKSLVFILDLKINFLIISYNI